MEKLVRAFLERHDRVIRFCIPSAFSLSRLPFIPFIIWAVVNGYNVLALFLFAVAAFTDFLDGFFARLIKAETNIGSFLDPLCDKILILSTLAAVNIYVFPTPAFALLFYYFLFLEIVLVLVRMPGMLLDYKIAASWFGKTKMFFEVALIFALLLFMGNTPVWLIVSLSLLGGWSGGASAAVQFAVLVKNRHRVKEYLKDRRHRVFHKKRNCYCANKYY